MFSWGDDDSKDTDPLLPKDLKKGATKEALGDALDNDGVDNGGEPVEKKASMEVMITSPQYELFVGCAILINAVFIGIAIDSPTLLSDASWAVIEISFVAFWATEMLLKLAVFGPRKFFTMKWNIFDFVVTVAAAIEMGHVGESIDPRLNRYVDGDFVQVLRLFRLLRLGSVFPALGVLIDAFVNSVFALGWVVAFSMIWFFIGACITTVFIGHQGPVPGENEEDMSEVRAKFASIPMSMFSLFEVMTLEGWCDYARPMLKTRVMISVFFILFIFVASFFLLNLITAVIVEKTLNAQTSADEEEKSKDEAKDSRNITLLCSKIRALNENQDLVSREQLEYWIRNKDIADIINELGWDDSDHEHNGQIFVMSMFTLCDHDHNGQVQLSRLEKLMASRKRELTTSTYVHLEVNLARRIEYLERLNILVLRSFEKVAQQKGGVKIAKECEAALESRSSPSKRQALAASSLSSHGCRPPAPTPSRPPRQ